ncbi:hypothetical protein [Lacrimispora sp.]|uniref:hypothetical protein n=1 Tax=Lacrimispora sp. TaxID=2719234 RepID=UPI0028A2261F|nr:hypothetical protein [Lacrimispora sp.]
MKKYSYSSEEKKILKVMKMNQEDSIALLNDESQALSRHNADTAINDSLKILESLGNKSNVLLQNQDNRLSEVTVKISDFEDLAKKAEQRYDNIEINDLLSDTELQVAYDDLDRINKEFSKRTSIINKTDLTFLAIATAIQVTKSLITPIIATKFGYGESFDRKDRLAHNDPQIEKTHKKANDKFKNDKLQNHETGQWINLLYQTPPYDITVGSPSINFNMEGGYHRLHTLGHDPILGWVFGTANILTDIITLDNLQSYRIIRKPQMKITPNYVDFATMFRECYDMARADSLNLPAALFAQWQHLKSDEFTKLGLPVPLLEVFTPELAGKLYKNQYDALCLTRDLKIVGTSAAVTCLLNMIINLTHGFFYNAQEDGSRDLYEVRTRKILLVSNTLASTSSIVYSTVTSNPKNLDTGGLLITIVKLFSDVRFIARIKQEFIEKEIELQFQEELFKIDEVLTDYL